MRGRLTTPSVMLFVLGVLAGCGAGDEPTGSSPAPRSEPAATATAPKDVLFDTRVGRFRDVGLGDSAAEIRRRVDQRVLKRRRSPTTDVGLPWIIEPPLSAGTRPRAVRFREMEFLTTRRTGAFTVSVWRDGVTSDSGVRIGDPLNEVRQQHPSFECDVRNEHSEYPAYPYCLGRVGRLWVWYGEDPIKSITVSSTPVG